jgi:hypothetical protein
MNSPEGREQVNRFKQLTEKEINERVKEYTANMTDKEKDAFTKDPKYFEKLFPERFPNNPALQGARRRHPRRKTSRRKQ